MLAAIPTEHVTDTSLPKGPKQQLQACDPKKSPVHLSRHPGSVTDEIEHDDQENVDGAFSRRMSTELSAN